METSWISGLIGGVFIGAAAAILLLFNGKIFGVSGVAGGVLTPNRGDTGWRLALLLGLVIGGLVLGTFGFNVFEFTIDRSAGAMIAAGLLVGFGTRLGNGCTSGHGVCGIGRFSRRSIAATLTFTAAGGLSILLINHLMGGGS